MSFAIKNALIAVPALATLVLGLVFIALLFILIVRLITLMPLMRRALKIYITLHTPAANEKKAGEQP